MLRIAVCENNRWDRKQLETEIREYMDRTRIPYHLECFASGLDFMDHIGRTGSFQLAVISADLEGFNGVETAKELRQYDMACQIIFVSMTDEYAVSAYHVSAASYLLKPVTAGEMGAALESCLRRREEMDYASLVVKNASGFYNILYRSIRYLESSGHKINIWLEGQECLQVYGRLDDYEEAVQNDGRFLRIHKSTLVNMDGIFFMGREEIMLYDKTVLKISRTLSAAAKEQYFDYINRRRSKEIPC